MDIEAERAFVGKLYRGRSWKKKVSKMSDSQILAIYMREKRKPKKPKAAPKPIKEQTDDTF